MPRRKAAVIAPPRDTSSDAAALRTLYRKEAFFRLVHTGSELPLRATVPGYTIRQVDTTTELPLMATILHACYDTPTPGTDEIVMWTRRCLLYTSPSPR